MRKKFSKDSSATLLIKQEVKLFRMRTAFVFCVLAYFYGRNWNSQIKPTETSGGGVPPAYLQIQDLLAVRKRANRQNTVLPQWLT